MKKTLSVPTEPGEVDAFIEALRGGASPEVLAAITAKLREGTGSQVRAAVPAAPAAGDTHGARGPGRDEGYARELLEERR